ncbi:MAG: fused MFS/spermidine synthase, partial [Candidatus Eremiobacterota bacterium]
MSQPEDPSAAARVGRTALLCFFLSGATGLVYEVLWTRRLTLTFGHTVLAVSTVLTAYMLGLALGSLAGGRWSDRQARDRDPARFLASYGGLEAFIGIWALLSIPLLGLVERLYLSLSRQGLSELPLHLSCFTGSVLVLLPPTVAMGATLPVMSRLLVHRRGQLGNLLSLIYGTNTLGAFLGAGLAGFVLLPRFGLLASLLGAAGVNLAIGGLAWSVGRRAVLGLPAVSAEEAPERPAEAGSWLLPAVFGMAGMASMAYQIGWTRALALSLGSSIYAFSSILTTFLAGLGLGSLLYPRIIRGRQPRPHHLALVQLGVGLLGALTIPILGYLPRVFLALFPHIQDSFLKVLAAELAISALVLFGPTFLMGLAFPLLSHLYTTGVERLGRSIGTVYSANTFGCIVGSFVAGFFLIPGVGSQTTLKLAAALNLLLCAALLWALPPFRRAASLAVAVLAGCVFLFPRWDPGVMAAGVAIRAASFQNQGERQLRLSLFNRPAFYKDGLSCLVSVHYFNHQWRTWMDLRVNGKADASLTTLDKLTMYLCGYLGAWLHPDPKDVAVIGLGSGMTLEGLANVPGIRSIECAELERAVVDANVYWQDYTNHILRDPRVRLHVTDGRTFIMGSPRKFDIIASEPSNVWIAGTGNLFTRDFYRSCRDRLNPGGVMCQWLYAYSLPRECIDLAFQTFFEVFPYGMLFQTNSGDLIMVGSDQPIRMDLERLESLYNESEGMQRNFYAMDIFHPLQLLGHYVAGREEVIKSFPSRLRNTDDRPLLEFYAPMGLYVEGQLVRNFDAVRAVS